MLGEAPLPTKESDFVSAVKHDSKYDIVKFILSLLVLAIHSTLYPMVLYPWLRIAVPLFFMMSSYFLFSKLREASKDNHRAILRKFVVRNLQLYLCWFIILLPITVTNIGNERWSNSSWLPRGADGGVGFILLQRYDSKILLYGHSK